jgi:fibronectin-binding autotransporter adhesin
LGSFTMTGLGTSALTLSGNNTYSGVTIINSGTLRAGSSTGLSSSSAFTVNSELDLNGFSETIASLAGATTGIVTNTQATIGTLTAGGDNTSTTFSGAITGNLELTKTGAGTLILTGTTTYTGVTTINGTGTLQIGNATTTGSITGDIIDNAHLIFDRANTFQFGGSISGTGYRHPEW